jgi:hypothetical protein
MRNVVWRVVCLAYLSSLDSTRAMLYTVSRGDTPPPRDQLISRARQFARYQFWAILINFTTLSFVSARVKSKIGPNHPFIFCRDDGVLETRHVT